MNNKQLRVLVTCPPMIGMIEEFRADFVKCGVSLTIPNVVQVLSVEDLKRVVPDNDGWIIGDDPATREVLEAGKAGRLKAAVKWGVGVDNIDFAACRDLKIPIANTPGMFGSEVADVAVGYVIALARETFRVDRGVRKGDWPKPQGISLSGRTAAIVGYGDIGKNISLRLRAAGMRVIAYDPQVRLTSEGDMLNHEAWPNRLNEADFIVLACQLNDSTHHLINRSTLAGAKQGVRIVNVARGSVINQSDLVGALQSGLVHSAALDVFEVEPLPEDSPLREFSCCILGSHNSSNTIDAVRRTSKLATEKLFEFLGVAC